jgi:triosephosphate isomerase
MRKKIVAGNWKMNTTCDEGAALAGAIVAKKEAAPAGVLLILAPPFTHLNSLAGLLFGKGIGLSAQNCAAEKKGAYTGEVAADMLAAMGVEYCIIGHSERRQYYSETDEILYRKVQQALASGLRPIFCVGETLREREENRHFEIVQKQLEKAILPLSPADFEKIIVAYEPVWAIGTGKTATAAQAQEMHAFIRRTLAGTFAAAQQTPILYGGSCNPANAKELFAQPDVDGGLIGGASLKADDFIAIAQSF